MKKLLLIIAACAATALPGAGVAYAEPAPAPEPNGPKCWVDNDEGHRQLTPCGWAYSDHSGWYQVPWGFMGIP